MSGPRQRAESQPAQQEAAPKPAAAPQSTAGIYQFLLQKDFQKGVSAFGSAVGVITSTHPLDTFKRRLQTSSAKKIAVPGNPGATVINYTKACLGTSYGQGPWAILRSSYSGLPAALVYKTGQLPYRWVMQNKFRDQLMTPSLTPVFQPIFGTHGAKILCGGLAGTLTGIIEPIFLLKPDSDKIYKQTNPSSTVKLTWTQAYRPIWWTMGRNGSGSFFVFGTEEAVKAFIYKGKSRDQLSFWQLSLGYCAGGIAGVLVPMPADTVKSKMQKEGSVRSGRAIAVEMYNEGGVPRFYRSLGVGSFLTGIRAGLGLAGAEVLFPIVSRKCKELAQSLQDKPAAPALPRPKL